MCCINAILSLHSPASACSRAAAACSRGQGFPECCPCPPCLREAPPLAPAAALGTLRFLKLLKTQYPGKRIFLIWDQAPGHNDGVVVAFLKEAREDDWLRVAYIPGGLTSLLMLQATGLRSGLQQGSEGRDQAVVPRLEGQGAAGAGAGAGAGSDAGSLIHVAKNRP